MALTGSGGDILHPLEGAEWHLWVLRISKLIARAWSDEAFKAQFIADPVAALRAVGLAVPEGAEVVVQDGATEWSMSGTSLTRMNRLTLPIPPKPTTDAVLRAWAEGETGHPPILSDKGTVAFTGLPTPSVAAAPWRAADGRRVTDGGFGASDATARRVAEGRRVVDEDDFNSAESVARRAAEARRIVEDGDPQPIDSEARRATEGRRVVEEDGSPADGSVRRTTEGRRVTDETGPAGTDASGRRVADDRGDEGPDPSAAPDTNPAKPDK